jgi:hypothetical protein
VTYKLLQCPHKRLRLRSRSPYEGIILIRFLGSRTSARSQHLVHPCRSFASSYPSKPFWESNFLVCHPLQQFDRGGVLKTILHTIVGYLMTCGDFLIVTNLVLLRTRSRVATPSFYVATIYSSYVSFSL